MEGKSEEVMNGDECWSLNKGSYKGGWQAKCSATFWQQPKI